MLVLITYDVSTINKPGQRRLARIAKTCLNYGQRVQNSVFECLIDPAQWTALRAELLRLYKSEEDSLRFYFLGSNWENKVEHHGSKETLNLESGTLIV
jgi:CRISPR-associated protein Cas2